MTSEVMARHAHGRKMDHVEATTRREPKRAPRPPVGDLLREWRGVRRLSQLDLALEAGVSSRHLSYVETGKSQPSREMVARLADALGVPLRERNALLLAAGYAPAYPDTALAAPALSPMRHAIDLILAHQEPYPAFLLDRRWNILQANGAAQRVARFLCGSDSAHRNMLRQFFDPHDLRAAVVNWTEVAGDLLRHLHDELAVSPSDPVPGELLEEILRYPGVPADWRRRDPGVSPPPVLTVHFRKGDQDLRFFSTITTFATARDLALDDLRIECAFPADESTAERCRTLVNAPSCMD